MAGVHALSPGSCLAPAQSPRHAAWPAARRGQGAPCGAPGWSMTSQAGQTEHAAPTPLAPAAAWSVAAAASADLFPACRSAMLIIFAVCLLICNAKLHESMQFDSVLKVMCRHNADGCLKAGSLSMIIGGHRSHTLRALQQVSCLMSSAPACS